MSFILLKLFLDNSTRCVIRLYQAIYCEILLQAQALNHTLISANVIWINYRLQKTGHSSFHAQPCSYSLSFVTFNFSFPLFAQPQFSIFSLSALSLGKNVNSTLFFSPFSSILTSDQLIWRPQLSGCLHSWDPPKLCILQHRPMSETLTF